MSQAEGTTESDSANENVIGERALDPRLRRSVIILVLGIFLLAILVVSWFLVRNKNTRAVANTQDKPTQPPTVLVSHVLSKDVDRQLKLPGELRAYQDVAIYPKVQGFVETINVDRGSVVKRGQLLIRMSAPELSAHTAEAQARVGATKEQRLEMESRVRAIREQRAEATARLAADEGTYRRLKAASETPGVVAGNDVDVALQNVEADKAHIRSLEENQRAAEAVVQSQSENEKAAASSAKSVRDIESYLRIQAPFDGIVTERNVDTGSFAGPTTGGGSAPMLRIQQVSKLRLVVAVPEVDVAGVTHGDRINFTVPAYPGETFTGLVARISHTLDEKTRTMPVEVDVINESARLAPGMFPEVVWPAKRLQPSLFVPASAIAVTTDRTFLDRIRNGVVEWVDVKRGVSMGDLVEVFGDLAEGDVVAMRGTDELRAGTRVNVKEANPSH
ncbi:MAG: efflux RND transporter periplasmic adaptor subunit [Blastocatellia bacterium]|nr:MAG: efflux RND transporter periplasmic adaptor subunit [Blastocatellia bacterium]